MVTTKQPMSKNSEYLRLLYALRFDVPSTEVILQYSKEALLGVV